MSVITPADIPSVTWIDPYGVSWPMTNTSRAGTPGYAGYFTCKGVKGLGAAPVQYTTDPVDRGGVSLRNAYNPPRVLTWPMFVEGSTRDEFLTRWRALATAFTSTQRRGPGTLVITQKDGTQRAIQAVYQDGFDHDPTVGNPLNDIVVMTLLCPKPWFRAVAPTLISRAYVGTAADFLNPFPNVSSSVAFGATTFVNPGQLPVWPDWLITGPAGTITATNNSRGETWTLDIASFRGTSLAVGETVSMTSDPPAVVGPDGSSYYGALNNPAAALWRLDDGSSNITFQVTGAGVTTSISASFYQLYETA